MLKLEEVLEVAYAKLNMNLFEGELDKCAINIMHNMGKRNKKNVVMGIFFPNLKWKKGQENLNSISITSDAVNEGKVAVLETLVHEMTHAFCDLKGIKDTNGKRHTKEFKDVAEEKALLNVQNDANLGYAMTSATEQLLTIFDKLNLDESVFDVRYNVLENKEPPADSTEENAEENPEENPEEKAKKVKLCCPNCTLEVTSNEADTEVICGRCSQTLILKELRKQQDKEKKLAMKKLAKEEKAKAKLAIKKAKQKAK